MKLFLLGCFSVLGTVAFASFDMLLIADSVNGKINRYDPENRTELGGFYLVGGTPKDIAVNIAANEAYVLGTGFTTSSNVGFQRYNYNTGAFLGTVLFPASSYGNVNKINFTNNGELLVSYDRDVVRYNATTGAQIGSSIFYSGRSFTYQGGAVRGSNGLYYLASDSDGSQFANDYIISHNTFGNTVGSYSDGSAYTVQTYRDIVASGTKMLVSLESANGVSWAAGDEGAGSFAVQAGLSIGGVPILNRGAEWGHGTSSYLMYSLASTPNQMLMRRFDTALGNFSNQWTVGSFTGGFAGTAMVLAPEPGAMFGIALGIACLVRRRKA
ncbi:MAG: PEP-CTERM sorting domain-containing protein [Armatimonadetes bacterium]|nr:PEP-CTERM sorting domain-containing protein [Armatimonadota bacterium]